MTRITGSDLTSVLGDLPVVGVTQEDRLWPFLKVSGVANWGTAAGTLGTPVEAVFQVPTGKLFAWSRTLVFIEDNVNDANEFDFGGQVPLINGCRFVITDSADVETDDFTDELVIKRNVDWSMLAGVDNKVENSGQGQSAASSVIVRWEMFRGLGGAPLLVPEDSKIKWLIRDARTQVTGLIVLQGSLRPQVI